MTMTVSTGKG